MIQPKPFFGQVPLASVINLSKTKSQPKKPNASSAVISKPTSRNAARINRSFAIR